MADLIVRSGAEPLRVYPILFELEQSGWLEVTERGEWGAPRWVRLREKSGKGTRLLRINLYICANLIREEYYVYCERWGKRDFRIFVE